MKQGSVRVESTRLQARFRGTDLQLHHDYVKNHAQTCTNNHRHGNL